MILNLGSVNLSDVLIFRHTLTRQNLTKRLILVCFLGAYIHKYTTTKIIKNMPNMIINRPSKQRKWNQYDETNTGVYSSM